MYLVLGWAPHFELLRGCLSQPSCHEPRLPCEFRKSKTQPYALTPYPYDAGDPKYSARITIPRPLTDSIQKTVRGVPIKYKVPFAVEPEGPSLGGLLSRCSRGLV